ncbi:Small GTPase superfamily [Carpediemonas membranifera]|uniref:small monomeric GTPase n=1 Tax=Carpediemonas membranifera TaxID=201153 RepID=A0A8J6BAC6_9EUKA|nr:Small GTPase superfamily [Carpediemonas membranifera]|eukprot:KAG9396047.1 Small GTPase superfamily [Carpediemonas membranifera]
MAISSAKVVVMGSGGVGKSAMTVRFVKGKFVAKYDPTIQDFYKKQVECDGEAILLDILDTAGQEEYSSLRDQYMRDAHGFVLVYSITSSASFDDCRTLREQILRVKEKAGEEIPLILVGNKSDLDEERAVSDEEGKALAEEFGCLFIETSAKEDINVEQTFMDLTTKVLEEEAKNPTKPAKKSGGGCLVL